MYILINLFFGGKAWAQVIEWGAEEFDSEGWSRKKLPLIVLTDMGLHQRGPDEYYYPI